MKVLEAFDELRHAVENFDESKPEASIRALQEAYEALESAMICLKETL